MKFLKSTLILSLSSFAFFANASISIEVRNEVWKACNEKAAASDYSGLNEYRIKFASCADELFLKRINPMGSLVAPNSKMAAELSIHETCMKKFKDEGIMVRTRAELQVLYDDCYNKVQSERAMGSLDDKKDTFHEKELQQLDPGHVVREDGEAG